MAVREEIEVMLYASGSYAFVLKDGMASGQVGGVGAVVKEGGVRPWRGGEAPSRDMRCESGVRARVSPGSSEREDFAKHMTAVISKVSNKHKQRGAASFFLLSASDLRTISQYRLTRKLQSHSEEKRDMESSNTVWRY